MCLVCIKLITYIQRVDTISLIHISYGKIDIAARASSLACSVPVAEWLSCLAPTQWADFRCLGAVSLFCYFYKCRLLVYSRILLLVRDLNILRAEHSPPIDPEAPRVHKEVRVANRDILSPAFHPDITLPSTPATSVLQRSYNDSLVGFITVRR